MTDDEKIAEYIRRITPIREQYDRDQERLEGEADFLRRETVARSAQGRTGGRYWALGLALAAMAVQPQVDAIAAQLEDDIADLNRHYQETCRKLREEIGL